MQNPRQLLTQAFEAQRRDRNIPMSPEYRIAGIERVNGSSFIYVGELPQGIREFAREASAFGKDPYIVFDGPLDMDLMEQASGEVFGRRRVERETEDRMSIRSRIFFGVFDGGKYLLRFWRQRLGYESGGVLEYYTDTSASEFSAQTPKVVETIARYLELKAEKRAAKETTSQKSQSAGSA